MKHTPGPWFVLLEATMMKEPFFLVAKGKKVIATKISTLTDANLIAAAPELIEVLNEALIDWWGGLDDLDDIDDLPESWKVPKWVKKARLLTAKVKGE